MYTRSLTDFIQEESTMPLWDGMHKCTNSTGLPERWPIQTITTASEQQIQIVWHMASLRNAHCIRKVSAKNNIDEAIPRTVERRLVWIVSVRNLADVYYHNLETSDFLMDHNDMHCTRTSRNNDEFGTRH